MDPERWERLQELFAAAVDVPSEERAAYVNDSVDDAELRAELLSLIEAHEATGRLDGIAEDIDAIGAGDAPAMPERVGPYGIVRPIAQGGMGSVYLAERTGEDLKYTVALKLSRRDLETEELRQRFLVERQILARINHPNIARLLDAGITDEGRPYFVMEYVEGVPIDEYCDAHRLDVSQRLGLFLTVCGAVQHAHRNLVVHRDIKPANILVGADGHVKLLDFGIAKVLDTEAFPLAAAQTRTGHRLLTPEYASPEQYRGEPVTTASDVYQLGLLLYQLLSGRLPQVLDSPVTPAGASTPVTREVRRPSLMVSAPVSKAAAGADAPTPEAVAAARRVTPLGLRRRLSGDLDNIALLALREEPERRYASAERLAEDVRRHLDGLPVAARPERLGYVASKFVRRHWGGVSAAALALILLIAFAVGTGIQARRVARERDRAQQVSSLLLNMFESASPDVSRGDTITVVQVLDRGAEGVRTALGGQPDVQGTMLAMLAEVYDDLGQPSQAAALAGEALQLRQMSVGPEHPETVWNMVRLASFLAETGQLDSALLHAERAVSLSRARLGSRNLVTARALQMHSFTLQLEGDLTAARPLLEEAISIFRSESGDSARLDLASALVNLSFMEQNDGDLESAVATMRESVAIRRALLDPEHPKLLNSISSLGAMLFRQGDLAAADTLMSEALEIRRRIFPAGHPEIGKSLVDYARVLEAKGDLDGAERYHREALASFRQAYGDRSGFVAQTLNNLGLFLHFRLGDLPGAEAVYRESASILAEIRGPRDPWTALVEANLATAIYLQGRFSNAEALYRRAIAALEVSYPPTSPLLGRPLMHYGVVLTRLGKTRDAEPVLRRALEIERTTADSSRIAMAEAALGMALSASGQLEEAELLLLSADSTLSRIGGPFFLWALDALGKLYLRQGRTEEAALFRKRLDAASAR